MWRPSLALELCSAAWCSRPSAAPRPRTRLGFDTKARLLATVVLVFASGDEMLIHTMPARKQHLNLLP